jgi:hypothetical protein
MASSSEVAGRPELNEPGRDKGRGFEEVRTGRQRLSGRTIGGLVVAAPRSYTPRLGARLFRGAPGRLDPAWRGRHRPGPEADRRSRLKGPPVRLLNAFLILLTLAPQNYPPPYPRTNATKLLENDRIAVWDMVWPKGQPSPMHRHVHDQVGTYYVAGGRAITTPEGTTRTNFTEIGALSTTPKDTTHVEEGTTDPPLRAVFIELKQEASSGRPAADAGSNTPFPGGGKELLNTERVMVSDRTWTTGAAASTYIHPHDSVIVWLDGGTLRLTPADGTPTILKAAPGQMVYRARGTVETVEVVEGSPRAYVFAIK